MLVLHLCSCVKLMVKWGNQEKVVMVRQLDILVDILECALKI